MDRNGKLYRPCVGVMVLNRAHQVLVGERLDVSTSEPNTWQMPQGGIEEGEDAYGAALRELGEETGIAPRLVRLAAESDRWHQYDLPEELIGKLWGGKYRGQRQKWYALDFLGTDEDINIATDVPEFRAWKWARMEALPDLIIPFKRPLYEEVVTEFRTKLGL